MSLNPNTINQKQPFSQHTRKDTRPISALIFTIFVTDAVGCKNVRRIQIRLSGCKKIGLTAHSVHLIKPKYSDRNVWENSVDKIRQERGD